MLPPLSLSFSLSLAVQFASTPASSTPPPLIRVNPGPGRFNVQEEEATAAIMNDLTWRGWYAWFVWGRKDLDYPIRPLAQGDVIKGAG